MYFTAYFTDDGSPKTGLSPTITVYDLSDSSKVVDGANMTEVALGLYKYQYTSYDSEKDYVGRADGGATLTAAAERYVPVSSGINAIGETVEGTVTLVRAVRAILSVFAAKRIGMRTLNTKFRDQGDSKDRLDVTLDAQGNITAVTLDLT